MVLILLMSPMVRVLLSWLIFKLFANKDLDEKRQKLKYAEEEPD